MNLKAIAAILTLSVASAGAASAGPVAWNISIGGIAGNMGFGVGVATAPPVFIPAPVCAVPRVVLVPPPGCVAPLPVVVAPPFVVAPRRHHRMRPPVFVQAPPCVTAPVGFPPRMVFAQPPVYRTCR